MLYMPLCSTRDPPVSTVSALPQSLFTLRPLHGQTQQPINTMAALHSLPASTGHYHPKVAPPGNLVLKVVMRVIFGLDSLLNRYTHLLEQYQCKVLHAHLNLPSALQCQKPLCMIHTLHYFFTSRAGEVWSASPADSV